MGLLGGGSNTRPTGENSRIILDKIGQSGSNSRTSAVSWPWYQRLNSKWYKRSHCLREVVGSPPTQSTYLLLLQHSQILNCIFPIWYHKIRTTYRRKCTSWYQNRYHKDRKF